MTSLATPRRSELPPFDPLVPGFTADPFPSYELYRREDPLHRQGGEDDRGGHWYVFRHADVTSALTNAALGRGLDADPPDPSKSAYPSYSELISKWMVFRDPPHHTRVRDAFSKALSQLGMKRLGPYVERVAERQVDALPAGSFDLVAEYAFALPVLLVAELIGVPDGDKDRFRGWSNCIAAAIDLAPGPEVLAAANQTAEEVTEYLRVIFAERRRAPQADLVSALVAHQDAAGTVDEEELISNCFFLLCAGHETTTNLIGNGMLALLRNPDQATMLRDRPERMASAVEEFLRFDSPVQMTTRVVREDTELAGAKLQRGQSVHLLIGSANRDPEVFAEPDRLDVLRSPNPHTAFGVGPHYCLGASLGRLEAQVAIRLLLERFPKMRLTDAAPVWRRDVAFRGLERLPVAVD